MGSTWNLQARLGSFLRSETLSMCPRAMQWHYDLMVLLQLFYMFYMFYQYTTCRTSKTFYLYRLVIQTAIPELNNSSILLPKRFTARTT